MSCCMQVDFLRAKCRGAITPEEVGWEGVRASGKHYREGVCLTRVESEVTGLLPSRGEQQGSPLCSRRIAFRGNPLTQSSVGNGHIPSHQDRGVAILSPFCPLL